MAIDRPRPARESGAAYGSLYALLLRLYPRSFREQFAEGMTQVFGDLRRERLTAHRGLVGLVVWIYVDTLKGVIVEHANRPPKLVSTMLRVALGALAFLTVPLVASRVVEGWNWPPKAFVLLFVLLFATGMAFALVARRMGAWSYKAGVGVALATAFALGWSNMVHVADSENPANLAYYGVLVLGALGAGLARFEARGLARTTFTMAAVLAAIALLLPSGAPPELARRMAISHAVSVTLLLASGFLFRHASLGRAKDDRPAF
jgi:hypothetical protein